MESRKRGVWKLKSADFIAAARLLTESTSGKPRQAFLRRAASTAYYALFHELAQTSADLLIGGPNANRSKHAWRQAYRALEHKFAKNACKNQQVMNEFPKPVEDFGSAFVTMQIKRQQADYDPEFRLVKTDVVQDINNAESVIQEFGKVSRKDRRAFVAFVLFKTRYDQ